MSNSNEASVTVDSPAFPLGLEYIQIEGPVSVVENTTAGYNCWPYYSEGTKRLVEPDIWDVDCSYASISATGLLTTYEIVADELCRISASYEEDSIIRTETHDTTITDTSADTDGDILEDNDDNCPYTHNPNQVDSDGEGIGDVCDSDYFQLLLSFFPNRFSPVPLEKETVGAEIFVFTTPDSDVLQVSFFLDDPGMSGSPVRVERYAPYDFGGSTRDDGIPYSMVNLADGLHEITALIELNGGGSEIVSSIFTVANQ